MEIVIDLPFKRIYISSDQANISIATKSIDGLIQRLIDSNNLTVEELLHFAIDQIKRCDKQNLPHVLSERLVNKLNKTYQRIINGDENV